jgi:hypothetical protein
MKGYEGNAWVATMLVNAVFGLSISGEGAVRVGYGYTPLFHSYYIFLYDDKNVCINYMYKKGFADVIKRMGIMDKKLVDLLAAE